MDLCDALRRALGVEEEEELESLESVLDRYSVRELALLWLGETELPKGGGGRREYLSARRTFERYRAGLGRGPRGGRETRAPADLDAFLDSLRERIHLRRRPGQDRAVTIRGTVKVSKDTRRRTIRGELGGDCASRIIELLEEDLCDEAVEAFEECFAEGNDFGGQVPHWDDVDELVAR